MEKLIKKLTLVGKVNTNSLSIWWDIYDYILNGNVDIQDVEVNEDYYLYREEFDVTDEDEWITFDDCRDIEIKIENNTLCAYCKAYDKETQYIDDELPILTHKWGIKLTLPTEFIKKFESIIESKFDKFCEDSYEKHLEFMRLQWIKNFKKEMLG
jgi:hypothetical protein